MRVTRTALYARIGNRLLKNVRMRVRHTFLSGLSLFPIVFVPPPVAIVRSSPNQTRPTGNIAAVGCSTFAVDEMQIFSVPNGKEFCSSENTSKQ